MQQVNAMNIVGMHAPSGLFADPHMCVTPVQVYLECASVYCLYVGKALQPLDMG